MKALQNTLRTSLVLLLAFVLFAGMIPAALAEENVIVYGTETAGEQDLVLTETAVSEPALMGTSAGERLSGDSKLVYEVLLPYIQARSTGSPNGVLTIQEQTDGNLAVSWQEVPNADFYLVELF